MSGYIQAEARLMGLSFELGVILMVSYDVLRLFRLLIPHKVFWTGIEDFIFWIYAAVMTFGLLFEENSGELRAYSIICVFTGMLLYDRIVSRSAFDLLKNVGRWITMKKRNLKRWKRGHTGQKEERKHGSKPQQEK